MESAFRGRRLKLKNRIALILPFFGTRLPAYLDLYFTSAKGRLIDIVFLTNLVRPGRYEPIRNLKWIEMGFSEFRDLVCGKLGRTVELSNVRKICDYKPMYGHLFSELIEDYEYWAIGDCDLIYGKALDDHLQKVLTGEYDVVTHRKNWISGAFCIFKNTEKMRMLYERSRDLNRVLQSSEITYFDEVGGQYFCDLERGALTPLELGLKFDSFSSVVWRSDDVNIWSGDVLCEDGLVPRGEVLCEGDRVCCNGKEVSVFHYVKAKENRTFFYPQTVPAEIDRFWIDRYGFYFSDRRFVRIVMRVLFVWGYKMPMLKIEHAFKRMFK